MLPSCGAGGAPHCSAATPCQPSSHVSPSYDAVKEPSRAKVYSSSNKHPRVTTSLSELAHQTPDPSAGPTLRAPATGSNRHVPRIPVSSTSTPASRSRRMLATFNDFPSCSPLGDRTKNALTAARFNRLPGGLFCSAFVDKRRSEIGITKLFQVPAA